MPLDAEVDAIFHLASPASPIGYWTYPFETIRVNTEGTMEAAGVGEAQRAAFLMASTSEAYGDPQVHPQVEEYWGNVNPIGERACYDESKRLGETMTMEYRRQYGTDARIVRIFNTYGPHNQLDDGRMIPNFITQALKNQPVTMHGTGEQTRSICYVEDHGGRPDARDVHRADDGRRLQSGQPGGAHDSRMGGYDHPPLRLDLGRWSTSRSARMTPSAAARISRRPSACWAGRRASPRRRVCRAPSSGSVRSWSETPRVSQ